MQTNNKLVRTVRSLEHLCLREICLLRACPRCYLQRIPALNLLPSTSNVLPKLSGTERSSSVPLPRNRLNELSCSPEVPSWFSRLCPAVHPIVWVRLHNFPCWPGKVLDVNDSTILVSFFGDYTSTVASFQQAFFHSATSLVDYDVQSLVRLSVKSGGKLAKRRKAPKCVSSGDFPKVLPVGRWFETPRVCDHGDADSSSKPTLSSRVLAEKSRARRGVKRKQTSDAALISCRDFDRALLELEEHVNLLFEKYPDFELPPAHLAFSIHDAGKYYGRFNPDNKLYDVRRQLSPTPPNPPESPLPAESLILLEGDSSKIFNPILETSPPAQPPTSLEARDDVIDPEKSDVLTKVPHSLNAGPSPPPHYIMCTEPILMRFAALQSDQASQLMELSGGLRSPHDISRACAQSCLSNGSSYEDPVKNSVKEAEDTIGMPPLKNMTNDVSLTTNEDSTVGDSLPNLSIAQKSVEDILLEFKSAMNKTIQKLELDLNNTEMSASDSGNETLIKSAKDLATQTDIETFGNGDFQFNLMKDEILRQNVEIQRCRLLLDYNRSEQAEDTRFRIAELRTVWDSELLAVLESAGKVWEREFMRALNVVKGKQWCSYCRREASYYCCWNTSYCNTVCQKHHWPSHMTTCARTKRVHSPTMNDVLPRQSSAVAFPSPTQEPSPLSRGSDACVQASSDNRISFLSPYRKFPIARSNAAVVSRRNFNTTTPSEFSTSKVPSSTRLPMQ